MMRKNGFAQVLVLAALLLMAFTGAYYYLFLKKVSVTLPGKGKQGSSAPPFLADVKLEDGLKIAYLKGGDLYLLEGRTTKQLTFDRDIRKFKWSSDGKSIGWINQKEFESASSGGRVRVGISVTVLNLESGETKNVVPQKHSDKEISELIGLARSTGLTDFDFVGPDPHQQIAYIRDGVWLKDLTATGNSKQIARDHRDERDEVDFLKNRTYCGVSWNRVNSKLLLSVCIHEGISTEVYDISSGQKEVLSEYYSGQWTPDGKRVIDCTTGEAYGSTGGCFVILLENKRKVNLMKKVDIFSNSAAISADNRLVAALRPVCRVEGECTEKDEYENGLYLVDWDGGTELITKRQKDIQGLGWSPDASYITFVISAHPEGPPYVPDWWVWEDWGGNKDYFDLWVIRPDGTGKKKLLEGISAYGWVPMFTE